MIQLSDSVRALIVERFATTGSMCRTAELIFFGGGAKGRQKGKWLEDGTQVEAPGTYPDDLVRECNAARALRLAQSTPRSEGWL